MICNVAANLFAFCNRQNIFYIERNTKKPLEATPDAGFNVYLFFRFTRPKKAIRCKAAATLHLMRHTCVKFNASIAFTQVLC